MVKYIIVLILLLSAVSVKGQVNVNIQWQNIERGNTGDTIYYDGYRKLTWPDFKGTPNAVSPAAAITESGFGYLLTMQSLNNRTSINITVYCYFSKNKSWVKRGMKNDYALLHEQHHYDITYINTCLFIQKLKEAKLTRSNYNSLSGKIYDECVIALNKMQDEYDGETSNGRKKEVQAEWNKRIDLQLAALAIN
jgi:hypothetical protein